MFKKMRIVITTLNENAQIVVATQLTAMRIKFANDGVGVFDVKVSEKQLGYIIKSIVPMDDVRVRMLPKYGIVELTQFTSTILPIRGN